MSYLDEALNRIEAMVREEVARTLPFRAIVAGTNGNTTTITRLEAETAGTQEYAKATADTFAIGDEVLVQPTLSGDLIILGEIRR